MTEREYMSGTAKLESEFELRFTPGGTGIAKADASINDVPGVRYVDLIIWEPDAWFGDVEWLPRMNKGATVGFRGKLKNRTWTGKDGVDRSRNEVSCFMIAPLWEKPRAA